jgi:hypothetical protein
MQQERSRKAGRGGFTMQIMKKSWIKECVGAVALDRKEITNAEYYDSGDESGDLDDEDDSGDEVQEGNDNEA